MVTIPAEQPYQARKMAESFGVDAERYDRARPGYPRALIDRIVAASPGRDVLDVGCGTGIAARQFQAAGCHVLGVEPDTRMADFARHSGIEVEDGTLEAWDPAGRTFDALTCAQAWHWVDPVAGAAKAAQIVRPGGRLAIFGHAFELPPQLQAVVAEVQKRVLPNSPSSGMPARSTADAYQAMYAPALDGIRATGEFSEPELWRFETQQHYTRDAYLDLLPTAGIATQLPPDQLAELLDGVGAAIDEIGGSFTMTYPTLAFVSTRG
jgi:SAM-dependent methyltransferase